MHKKLRLWHDEPGQFNDALSHTASKTGFSARLIEKDYFCSLILEDLEPLFAAGLVFKGGTSLSKIHAGFHRMSEDLDFAISIESSATRPQRRAAIQPAKEHLLSVKTRLPWLVEVQPLTGANGGRQYIATYSYHSQVSGQPDTIKVEIGLREEIVEPPARLPAGTILLDPLTSVRAIEPIGVMALSLRESYAEKIRAGLSRREPAIRDLFDIDHAVQDGLLDISEGSLLSLAKQKLRACKDEPADVSVGRFDTLRRQVETQLRPVLRDDDFARFDVERAFEILRQLEKRLR